jgi:hypothetical protein
MSTLALRLNEVAPSLPHLTTLVSGREMQRTIASAKQWLLGALGETAIGVFSRLYGLPAPARLLGMLGNESTAPAVLVVERVEALPIAAETQWERTAEIFARGVSGADAACRLHAAAGEQIDAADYALRLLHDDIAHLMIFSRDDEEFEIRRYPSRVARDVKAEMTKPETPAYAAA